jgi:DNA-binding transcriptional regulator GbsR (MarR family)
MDKAELIDEVLNNFGEAYKSFGLNALMGKIVALLIISPEPLSLDDISEKLEMSKGPVSQIARRLAEHHLIERVWVKGDRKDYYRAAADIFGQAYRNNARKQRRNQQIADAFIAHAAGIEGDDIRTMERRMREMKAFYELMDEYSRQFLDRWTEVKASLPE